jgi:PAS domain S-box-containing protein
VQDTDAAPLLDVISRAETLEQTVAAMPMAVVVVDREGRVVLWSGAAEELYGWRSSEVLGRPARELMVDAEAAPSADEVRAALERGERWMGTYPVKRRDGSTFTAWVVDAPVFAADGRRVGMVGVSLHADEFEPARLARVDLE